MVRRSVAAHGGLVHDEDSFPLQAFDPQAEFTIVQRRLPHWCQAGSVCFITFRTWD